MKAIVTVLGKDKPGIISKVSTALYEANANILDLNQTVLHDEYFAMTMLVELAAIRVSFDELKKNLEQAAKVIGVDIKLQREEIFRSMHSI